MPILGVVASSISGHLTPPYSTDFYSIQTLTVDSGGASSVTFSSIPSTYTHLQLRIFGRTNRTGSPIDALNMNFNNDSGSNYSSHSLQGQGDNSSAFAVSFSGVTSTYLFFLGTTWSSNNQPQGSIIVDILDYKNTNKNKIIKQLGGLSNNGNDTGQPVRIVFASGGWYNTSAINTITLAPNTGTSFTEYTKFALYGVK